MRFQRILAVSFAREVATYAALGFGLITLLLVSQNLVQRLDQLAMVGFGFPDFISIVFALGPMLASYATPIALAVAVVLALQRMSSDGEILAMQACGIGIGPLVVPALLMGAAISALTAWLLLSVEYRARLEMVQVFNRVATQGGLFEPGRFRGVGSRVVFVDGRDRGSSLEGVMIFDTSNPDQSVRIFAERGLLGYDKQAHRLEFNLQNGDVQIVPAAQDAYGDRRIAFEELTYSIDVGFLLGRAFSPVRPRQMSLAQLDEVQAKARAGESLFGLHQRNPVEYALETQRRYAMPFAPFLLVLTAIPLAVRIRTSGRATGALLALGLVVGYYGMIGGGLLLARSEAIAPTTAYWLPTGLFAAVGLLLLARAWRGSP